VQRVMRTSIVVTTESVSQRARDVTAGDIALTAVMRLTAVRFCHAFTIYKYD